MNGSVFLLLYGVVAVISGHPVFIEDDEGYYDYYDHPRVPRSLETLVKKTSGGALYAAREFIKTFLPSASQIGFQGMRRMAKRAAVSKPLPGVGLPTTTTANAFGKIVGLGIPTPASALPALTAAPVMSTTPSYYYNGYNFQYPGFTTASMFGYSGYPYYSSYAYPYYGNMYTPQYDVAKRTYMPYSYKANNNVYFNQRAVIHPQQSAYQYHYPAEFAAINAAKQSTDNPVTHAQVHPASKHNPVPDTSTATGISQGLIDLENDVNGFNQAIQYMKQAFISENNDGSSDLEEKIHEDKTDVVGDKKDLIKRKKSSQELIEAFKRTLDSKERLENKLVSYFTNYVCGDDC